MPELKTLGLVIAQTVAPYEDAQASVLSRSVQTPPAGAVLGDRYIVPMNATGAWFDRTNKIAIRTATAWEFVNIAVGVSAWICDEFAEALFNGTTWELPRASGGGSGDLFAAPYIADESISALRVARLSTTGHVVMARRTEVESHAPLGIARTAAAAGTQVQVVMQGPLSDVSWAWVPDHPVSFDADGKLVQLFVDDDYALDLGWATSPTTIVVRISLPIRLM